MSHARPPIYLRATVIIGATVLLLGLSGVIWLPDTPRPPERYAGVLVQFEADAPPTSELAVHARWRTPEGEVRTEDGSLAESGRLLLFKEAPGGVAVTFTVHRDASADRPRKHLATTEGILHYGGVLTIRVLPKQPK